MGKKCKERRGWGGLQEVEQVPRKGQKEGMRRRCRWEREVEEVPREGRSRMRRRYRG